MNTILNQLSEYLWLQSWQVAILIGAAFILCRALRHKSAHLRYMIWLMVLAHELAHVCRYDAAVNLLQVLAQSLVWVHPLVWWANAQIRTEREQCCDEMAIAHMKIDVKT